MRRIAAAAIVAIAALVVIVLVRGHEAEPSSSGAAPGAPRARAGRVAATGGSIAERRALEAKVGGLTRDELFDGIATGGTMPDVERFLWRASGLLELDADLAGEVGARVASGRLTGAAAELALDLLAAAGTEAAQSAMRGALQSPTVHAAANYPLLLQRMSLVLAPTADSAAWVDEVYQRERTGEAAYTLGAVARRLDTSQQPELARRYAQQLAGDLAAAQAPGEQSHLLGALGNAARAEHVDLVARFASSPDPGVRAAAARALGDTDTPRARQTLRALAADREARVQRSAIGSLSHHAVGGADLAALTEVARGQLRPGNQGALLNLAAAHRTLPEAAALLQAIADDPAALPEERARATELARPRS